MDTGILIQRHQEVFFSNNCNFLGGCWKDWNRGSTSSLQIRKISTVNTCESTSNQPPTPTGQTHRKKYTTSKAYQSHGGRIVTGKIFILTGAFINIDYKRATLQSGIHQNYGKNSRKGVSVDSSSTVNVGQCSNNRSRMSWGGPLFRFCCDFSKYLLFGTKPLSTVNQ